MTDGQTSSNLPFICLDQVIQSRSCLVIVLMPLANLAVRFSWEANKKREWGSLCSCQSCLRQSDISKQTGSSSPLASIPLITPDRIVLLQHMFIIHNKFLFGWRHMYNWYVSQWLSMPSALLPLTFWSNRSQNRHAQNHTLVSRPQPGQLHHGQLHHGQMHHGQDK